MSIAVRIKYDVPGILGICCGRHAAKRHRDTARGVSPGQGKTVGCALKGRRKPVRQSAEAGESPRRPFRADTYAYPANPGFAPRAVFCRRFAALFSFPGSGLGTHLLAAHRKRSFSETGVPRPEPGNQIRCQASPPGISPRSDSQSGLKAAIFQ